MLKPCHLSLIQAVIYFDLRLTFSEADPRVRIESSPSTKTLPFGVPLNLTCISSQNDELPKKQVYLSRPVFIQWFGPQGPLNGCPREADSPPEAPLRCVLMVHALTLGQFGNYTCQAASYSHCSIKRITIYPDGKRRSNFKLNRHSH